MTSSILTSVLFCKAVSVIEASKVTFRDTESVINLA